MKVQIDETKYEGVTPSLRERFFAFINAAVLCEMQGGPNAGQYLDVGPRGGRPLLFFTGGVKFPVFSFAVIEAFGRIRRVIAPVQPTCRTLAGFFEGVDAILEREKITSFALAGSSWGGQVAQAAALRYAGRVQEVVLANTGISSGAVLAMMLRLHRWLSARQAPRAVVEGFRVRALKMLDDGGDAGPFWKAVFDDLYERHMSREDYLSLIDTQIDYVEHYASEVRTRGFDGPVLILASRDETAGSVAMKSALRMAYPRAQVHLFESGGHHPALLHLEEYRKVVERFLETPVS
jgi:pimeloyl-ACP methyl ester carboxylesterase